MVYENRIVLFLDILGFKALIDKTHIGEIDQEDKIEIINSDLEDIRKYVKTELEGKGKRKSTQITQFSDSIIISFLEEEEEMVFNLLATIQGLIMKLVNKKIICRGAISYGKLRHTQNIIFGPALNYAYKTESTAAIYPRVILDETIIDISEKYNKDSPLVEESNSFNKDVKSFLSVDSDDKYYIDYFPEDIISIIKYGRLEGVKLYLSNLRSIIEEGMRFIEPDIQIKYGWMKNKYNNLIKNLKEERNIYKLSKREVGLSDFVNNLEPI